MNTYAERAEKTAAEKDKTGIPRRMKTGFENSSGFSFDDVRVHYNSEKPAQFHAHAYTQGNEVYVAPGQEKHLPHELGHVVQQKSDMVKPTGEIGGLPLNDDEAMENGADMIAENAENAEDFGEMPVQAKFKGDGIVQRNAVDTQESYNAWAGFGSTFVGMLGVAGGIGSFLYSKHNDRKHRYIEEIEKYADAACEAREEQIAAVEQFNEVEERTEKARARSEAIKLESRIARNYKAAIQKANAMGKIDNIFDHKDIDKTDIDNTDIDNTDTDNTDTDNTANENMNEINKNYMNSNHVKISDYDKINAITDKNVKNALTNAKKAYDERVTKNDLVMPQQDHEQEQRQQNHQQRRQRGRRRR